MGITNFFRLSLVITHRINGDTILYSVGNFEISNFNVGNIMDAISSPESVIIMRYNFSNNLSHDFLMVSQNIDSIEINFECYSVSLIWSEVH